MFCNLAVYNSKNKTKDRIIRLYVHRADYTVVNCKGYGKFCNFCKI
jgi:hypothetical protein